MAHPLSSVPYWLLTPSSFTIKQISAIYHYQVSRVWVSQRVRQLRQKLIQRHREHAKKSFSTKSSGACKKIFKTEHQDFRFRVENRRRKMTSPLVGEEICVCFGRKYRFGGWKRGAVLIIYRLDWIALGPALTKSIVKETSSSSLLSSPLLSSSPSPCSTLDC